MYVRLLAGQGPAFIYPSVNVWIEGNNEAPCGHSSVTTAVQLLLPTPTHRNCLYPDMGRIRQTPNICIKSILRYFGILELCQSSNVNHISALSESRSQLTSKL